MRIHTGVRFDEFGRPVGAVLSDNVPGRAVATLEHLGAGSLVKGRSGADLRTLEPEQLVARNAVRALNRAAARQMAYAETEARGAINQGSAPA